ncbi:ArsR/SmtB family transcription factor [Catellatospora coxensis]
MRTAVDADRGLRARTMLESGTEGLLNTLHPTVRFDGSVLEISEYPSNRDVYLEGRGLQLVPSYFKTPSKPVCLFDPELPPVLVYSVHHEARAAVVRSPEALAALLGRTRAAVVELLADGSTTTELARRLDVSPAAASQHVAVLREAGLVHSLRDRNTVLHTLTPLVTRCSPAAHLRLLDLRMRRTNIPSIATAPTIRAKAVRLAGVEGAFSVEDGESGPMGATSAVSAATRFNNPWP